MFCKKEYDKKYYENNKIKKLKNNRLWQSNNMDKVRSYVKRYDQNNIPKDLEKRIYERLIVLVYYSDNELCCNCCSENEYQFLTIDHINGNGSRERRSIKRYGSNFYRWLIDNGFPEGYQILCMNCNFAKGKYGVCPHTNSR